MTNFGEWANGRQLIPEVMDKMREAVILDPHERVIDIRRVNETIKSMEDDAIIRGGQALMERWGELKKELGITGFCLIEWRKS